MPGRVDALPAPGLRALGNVVNLSTPFGLLVARLGRARLHRGPDGLLLADGYRLRFPTGGAFTIGNVVITARAWPQYLADSPNVLRHEQRHTLQWLACAGLPFLPVYLAMTGWSMLRTGDRAARNAFERGAGLADGGYADVPVRPVGVVVNGLLRRARRRASRPAARP